MSQSAPSWETLEALARPLQVIVTHQDGQVRLHSTKTGGLETFEDTDEGREKALKWINADQKLLAWLKSLPAFPHLQHDCL